jgi:hypothetical protein
MGLLSWLKVSGLSLIDAVNEKYEPWKEFTREAEPRTPVLPGTEQSKIDLLAQYFARDLDHFLDFDKRLFQNIRPTDIADECVWQGVYSALTALSHGDVMLRAYGWDGTSGLALHVRDGRLLRGYAPAGARWLVRDINRARNYHDLPDGSTVLDDASLDSLVGFCFGASVAVARGECPGPLCRAVSDLAIQFAADKCRLTCLDGSFTKYGDCRPGIFQAPVRNLAAAVLLHLGHQMQGYPADSPLKVWKDIVRKYGAEFSRTETHLLANHPWFNDNLAVMSTLSALMSDHQEFEPARAGLRVLLKKGDKLGNAFLAAASEHVGEKMTGPRNTMIEKVLLEFAEAPEPNGKMACAAKNAGYPSVMWDKKRVATQPVPAWRRPNTDFFWQRSPYSLEGGDGNDYAGLDFLIAYAFYKVGPMRG